jgi:hypothetical protein
MMRHSKVYVTENEQFPAAYRLPLPAGQAGSCNAQETGPEGSRTPDLLAAEHEEYLEDLRSTSECIGLLD